jgi:hypothetical protein
MYISPLIVPLSETVRCPQRNRHGKSRKRRRGGESDGSDEEDGDDT